MSVSRNAKQTLLSRSLKPKKSFGQNFMINQHVNSVLTNAALSWGTDLSVIEIGAGTGSLTEHLLKSFPQVHAVERDRDLVPILRENFNAELQDNRLVIHEADGARFDLDQIFSKASLGVLVGNLPYHLTSSIIILALKHSFVLRGAVFLLQREVAERFLAEPNSKDYGFLTAILKLAFRIEKVAYVDRQAFWPVPNVDSAIIKLSSVDHGISRVADIEGLIKFVRTIFQQRRKKLSTSLKNMFTKEELLALGVNPDQRPEELRPEQFLTLYERYSQK